MFIKFRRLVSLILVLLSIPLIVWASLPNQHQVITQSITASEMQLPSSSQVAIPMMIETRQVLLEWPSSMRIGEKEEIALVFEPVETEVSSPTQQIESSNIYSSYNIMAEARSEVAGIRVFPANPTRVSMPAGQTVKVQVAD